LKKILFIEDNRELREITLEALELEGFEVIGAESGQQGIEIAKEQKPDIILCDIMMPDIDGFEVCTQLKQYASTSTTPFIFLTALSDNENIHRGIEVSADHYVVKPFTLSELLTTINTTLRKSAMADARSEVRLKELSARIIKLLPTNDEKDPIY
jgi:DNA-binding response OmpR family regulator